MGSCAGGPLGARWSPAESKCRVILALRAVSVRIKAACDDRCADRVYALVPLEGHARGDGRRTLVHVEGIDEPIVASRSEGAIAEDLAAALGQDSPRGRRSSGAPDGQEPLF